MPIILTVLKNETGKDDIQRFRAEWCGCLKKKENFIAQGPPSYFAELFRKDGMTSGHVIMLGPGNEAAAKDSVQRKTQWTGWITGI